MKNDACWTCIACPICEEIVADYVVDDFLKKTPLELTEQLQNEALKLSGWECGWEEAKKKIKKYKYDVVKCEQFRSDDD